MQILVSIGTVGAFPQIGQILPPCNFSWPSCPVLFSRSYAQVEPLDRFSRFMAQATCFRARMVLLGVRTMGDRIWGKYAPKMATWCNNEYSFNWLLSAVGPHRRLTILGRVTQHLEMDF